MASRPGEGEEAEKMDWGKIYTHLLAHLALGGYEAVENRSYLQIITLCSNLPEEIQLKIGLPFGGLPFVGGVPSSSGSNQNEVLNQDRDISVSDIDSICSMFSGL